MIKNECINYTLGDDLTGVDRAPRAQTTLVCGRTTCAVVLNYVGLGEEHKPFLVGGSGKCIHPAEDYPSSDQIPEQTD